MVWRYGELEKMWPAALANIKALAEGSAKVTITLKTEINALADKVWQYWTTPEHIMQWNQASDDWHCPQATNDLRPGGSFSYTMAAKDGSFSFEFKGSIDDLKQKEYVKATLGDGRLWKTYFQPDEKTTIVTEQFEAENTHSLEMQRIGWQAILTNFKKYTETN